MSNHAGLDKINTKGLKLIETYRGLKIYKCLDDNNKDINPGFVVVSRGYEVDSCLTDVDSARLVIDHFKEGN